MFAVESQEGVKPQTALCCSRLSGTSARLNLIAGIAGICAVKLQAPAGQGDWWVPGGHVPQPAASELLIGSGESAALDQQPVRGDLGLLGRAVVFLGSARRGRLGHGGRAVIAQSTTTCFFGCHALDAEQVNCCLWGLWLRNWACCLGALCAV